EAVRGAGTETGRATMAWREGIEGRLQSSQFLVVQLPAAHDPARRLSSAPPDHAVAGRPAAAARLLADEPVRAGAARTDRPGENALAATVRPEPDARGVRADRFRGPLVPRLASPRDAGLGSVRIPLPRTLGGAKGGGRAVPAGGIAGQKTSLACACHA